MKKTMKKAFSVFLVLAMVLGVFVPQMAVKTYATEGDGGIDVTIQIEKNLEGRAIKEGEFIFQLFDAADTNWLGEARVGADGKASFTVHETTPGKKVYYVRELTYSEGGFTVDPDITYDTEHKRVEFTITSSLVKPDGQVTYVEEHPKTMDEGEYGRTITYCINPNGEMETSFDGTRQRILVTDGSELTEILARNISAELGGEDVPSGPEAKEKFVKVLYHGYDLNKSGIGASYEETQNAVFWVSRHGKDGAPSYVGSNYKKGKAVDLLNFDNLSMPAEGTYNLYLYRSDKVSLAGDTRRFAQSMIALEIIEPTNEQTLTLNGEPPVVVFNNVYTGEPVDETPDTPKEESKLGTTVSVDEKKASADAALEVKVPAGETSVTKNVVDCVDYAGFVKGATYVVQGTLVEVKDGKVVKEVAASEPKEFTAEEENGTIEITFENVTLEVGKTYVVFEEATMTKNEKDEEVPEEERKPIEHKDPEDKAQTVVVKETPEEPKEEEPPEENEPPKENEPPTEETEEPKENTPPPQVPSTGQKEPPKSETPTTPPTTPQNPPQVPSTGNPPAAPNTGDTNDIMLWVLLGATAAFVATLTLRFRIKR